MTVATTTARATFTCNGVTTVFNFNFLFYDSAHVQVYTYDTITQMLTLLTQGADYTLSGLGTGSGSVTTATVYPATTQLVVTRVLPLVQGTLYRTDGNFNSAQTETDLDEVVMMIQQIQDSISRSILLPINTTVGTSVTFPSPNANYIIGWDGTGTLLENKLITTSAVVFASISALNAGAATGQAIDPATFAGSKFNSVGRHLIPLGAGAFATDTTTAGGGPDFSNIVTSTNKIPYKTINFDGTTQENAGLMITWPKSADEGTITFKYRWVPKGGSAGNGVVFGLAAIGFGDGDVIDTATGTVVKVTDNIILTTELHVSAESTAITIKNIAENDTVHLLLTRFPDDAGDTLNGVDAGIVGIDVFITTNNGVD